MASIRFERTGGIGGVAVAEALGRQAYRARKPVWSNPAVGEEARAWRKGYLAEQTAHGSVVYQDLPQPAGRPRLVIKGARSGGRATAAKFRVDTIKFRFRKRREPRMIEVRRQIG